MRPQDLAGGGRKLVRNVIGGPGSFQAFAQDFTAFAPAIEKKIEREIRGLPEPGILALLGISLGAFGFARRRA